MTPSDLAQAFLEENPKWIDIMHDTGGAGLCDHAAKEFTAFCTRAGHAAESLWMSLDAPGVHSHPFSGQTRQLQPHPSYPTFQSGERGQDHCITLVGDVGVDLTARQYGDEFEFPFIWKIPGKGSPTPA